MDIKDLESKTVAQLKGIAKELGITGISGMKKADLITAIAGTESAGTSTGETAVKTPAEAIEEAPGKGTQEDAPVEEGVVEATPEVETAKPAVEAATEEAPAEEAPVAETIPEAAAEPTPEPEPAEPEPATAKTESVKTAATPQAKAPEAAVQTQSRAKRKLLEKYDIPALKKEKKSLKGQIAQAAEAKDIARVRDLRNRKKELRRILNRAS